MSVPTRDRVYQHLVTSGRPLTTRDLLLVFNKTRDSIIHTALRELEAKGMVMCKQDEETKYLHWYAVPEHPLVTLLGAMGCRPPASVPAGRKVEPRHAEPTGRNFSANPWMQTSEVI